MVISTISLSFFSRVPLSLQPGETKAFLISTTALIHHITNPTIKATGILNRGSQGLFQASEEASPQGCRELRVPPLPALARLWLLKDF